ncbi:hypothetical protein RN001_009167 [Aquatica leii]|uniref:Ganglioside-induced differentiation-associated protein 1 n=1 Tax=Aquatica leii TaxID=1421715 RepID=A0AAN7S816_9COLE|nr:hypothetical protein RN001_009167 [Aquatica leii]
MRLRNLTSETDLLAAKNRYHMCKRNFFLRAHLLLVFTPAYFPKMSSTQEEASHEINVKNGLLLYHHPYSYYSQKVLMSLYEKNLPFEKQFINLVKEVQYEPWFLKLNPRGQIPVLQDTGKVIPDSARIIDYLEDNFSNGDTPRLIPINNPAVKEKVLHFRSILDPLPARVLTIGSFHHSELVHFPKPPFVGPIRSLLKNGDKRIVSLLKDLAETNPDISLVLLRKVAVYERKSSTITEKTEYLKLLDQFDEVLTEVENELASHTGDKENWWLCGDCFTVADISLTILLERLSQLGYESRFWKNGKRPYLEKYYARVKQRESYQKTIPNMLFHVKMFMSTYRKHLTISIGVGICAVIILGGVYIALKPEK